MTITITPLTTGFAGEVGAIDLRQVHDRQSLEAIRAGMDRYAVLVFRDQDFTNEEQLDFAQRFDGTLHARTSSSAIGGNRFGNEALADVSNVDRDGKIRDANNRMRASSLGNRLWHTDASFVDPPGRYSMLSARVVPPVRADTEFADMRAAYDALDPAIKARIEGLNAYHSLHYSQGRVGHQTKKLDGEYSGYGLHDGPVPLRPLVKTHPETGRKSLLAGRHAHNIPGLAQEESDRLLRELIDFACQPPRIYHHDWTPGDAVVWDNRCLMHQATPWDMTQRRIMWHSRIAGDPASESAQPQP
jgi:alpha-ketoglutarate-dependent 2,4-dichlorophenoxyacetate dioxygenase